MWTHDPTTDVYRRDDGLEVYQAEGAHTWSARLNGQTLETSGRRPARRAWGKAATAMAALDGERPAADTQPPHPASAYPVGDTQSRAADDPWREPRDQRRVDALAAESDPMWEDADRAGPVGQVASRALQGGPAGSAVGPNIYSAPDECLPAPPSAPDLRPAHDELAITDEPLPATDGPQAAPTTEPATAIPPASADASQGPPRPSGEVPVTPPTVPSAVAQPAAEGAGPAAQRTAELDAMASMRARAQADADRCNEWVEQNINSPWPCGWTGERSHYSHHLTETPDVPRNSAGTTPRVDTGPAKPAPSVQEGTPPPSSVVNAGSAAGLPDECQLLTEDDHRARRVELQDGRTVQRMTSSLVPMALGLSPHGGGFAAWAIATGQMSGPDDNERLRMGRRYEAPARDEYRFRHPEYRVQTVGTITREHWAADSADGLVLLEGEPTATLEIKHRTRADEWGMAGTDEVPADVLVQALWHLWAHEVERCDVVLVVGLKLTEYVVRRHEPTLRAVVERAEEWWHRHVLDNVEPPLDALPLTGLAVRAVYSQATEPPLEPDARVLELARRRLAWAAKEKEAAGYKELCDTALRRAMGAHKGIKGVLSRFPAKGKPDWKRILAENPAINLDAYRGAPEDRTLFALKPPVEAPQPEKKAPTKRAQGARP